MFRPQAMEFIRFKYLAVDNNIKPPILRKQAGRPRARRIRKGAWQRKQTRCGNCLDWGHNKKSCRGQPVSSGRRERARDWLAEGESGVDSDNGDQGTDIEDKDEDEHEDEDEDSDEDGDEDIEQEEEDQVVEEVDVELSDDGSDQFEDTIDSDMTYDVIEVMPRA